MSLTKKKRGLGNRGLDVLLGDLQDEEQADINLQVVDTSEGSAAVGVHGLKHIAVDCIQRSPFQPRRHFDAQALEELAESIRQQGLLQPIVVRVCGEANQYELIAGERRWRACQLAGLDTLPALVREADDATVAALALIENIQREELNPVEEASALQRLIDEFAMTHQQVADSIGRSRASVSNLLRLLSLNKEVKQMLSERKIEMGHAKVLLGLSGQLQLKAAREVVAKQLSVRQTESLVRQLNQPTAKSVEKEADADIQRLEQTISEKLGASVSIRHTDKGAGKLVIQYHSLDELDGILAHLD